MTMSGVNSVRRMVEAQAWKEVENNYPNHTVSGRKSTRQQVSELMDIKPEDITDTGKLILMYGPPGSGKTSLIRTLGLEWKGWTSVQTIMDPEKFFGDAAYMMTVILEGENSVVEEGVEDETPPKQKYNLYIIEDAAELLSPKAGGPALSRLLNVADGLIGQGVKALFLITTNVKMSEVHEAVARPGRALAEIEFPKFSVKESNEWLKPYGLATSEGLSLAELYGLVGSQAKVGEGAEGYVPSENIYV